MADGEDGEYTTDTDDSTYGRTLHGTKRRKKKRQPGHWKSIGTAPRTFATYPCECRWKLKFPKGPCINYKQVRWVPLPLSARIAQMALPLLRRLLALWLEFADKFPPEMRARLMGFLTENYGISEEFLEQILEEAKKAKEEAGKPKEKKPLRRGPRKGKRKGKGKKEKKEKPEKEEKPEKKVKEKASGLGFKRRKAGKLPLDWPYKTGSRFLLACISYLSQDPDEDFHSRAAEYFDVQSMGILEEVCRFVDMPLPDPERPTQYGETLVIMALNLCDWIAKRVITPAQQIPDDKVNEFLALRGAMPKAKKDKKGGKPLEKGAAGKKGKDAGAGDSRADGEDRVRAWDELKSPVYVPPKTRVSKRKPNPDDPEEGYGTETDALEPEPPHGGFPRWRKQTLDDVKKEFLEYVNWYNPWAPEFMYLGPKITPKGIYMFKIRNANDDSVPDDLRVLHWNMIERGYSDSYSFVPSPVPQYYPSLRPLRPVRLEDLERSGIPKEVIKQSLRFFSPWYIMSRPLREKDPEPKPATPAPGTENEETGGDQEEPSADEIAARAAPPVKHKDSLWGDPKMKEQLEILCRILHLAVSVPDLTIEHVFELLEEFCEAVECATVDENPVDENKLLLQKRTIILERYYLEFFGKKFRDYNDRTPYYMRVVCSRLAYYIQLLFEYTARNLWELQSRDNPPSPIETPGETPDDPQALRDWDEWIAWLLRVTETCDEWAGWISETVDEAERKAAKRKGEFIGPDGKVKRLTQEEWFGWKEEVEGKVQGYRASKKIYAKESVYYLERAKDILPVRHRPVKKYAGEHGGEDDDDWHDTSDTERHRKRKQSSRNTDTEDATLGDTEYEDITTDN